MQDTKSDRLTLNEFKLIDSNPLNAATRADDIPSDKAKVVIVGAGLAGLAAAQRLHDRGIDDVVILDAQSRVGGRVHTINHSDYLLELGAQWLHGADDNPLFHWLTSLDMLDDFQSASLGFEGIFCTSADSSAIDSELVKRVLDIVRESKLALSKDEHYLNHLLAGDHSELGLDNHLDGPDRRSRRFKNAGQVFKCHLDMKLNEDKELASRRHLVYAIFDWFLRFETIENCCDSMNEVSIQSYTDWTDLGDGALLNFKNGYRSLLRWFCEHIPCDRWLHLNKRVLNIELLKRADSKGHASRWFDSENQIYDLPVLVKYQTIDHDNQMLSSKITTISCNHLIVTSSLGFLKRHMRTFFTPELPQVKQNLIRSIGFGTVNKIVLQFESSFWERSEGIKLVWRETDFQGEDAFPVWCNDIISFDVVRRQPNLLIGWIGGKGAKLIENEPDETVGQVCLAILEKFLPKLHERPSKLLACFCSRWFSNPYTCGSYSFQSMDSIGLNVDKLHEPLYCCGDSNDTKSSLREQQSVNSKLGTARNREPLIMFAGEATAGKLYSTTHGAIISGWREADRLNEYLSKNDRLETNGQLVSNIGHGIRAQI